MVLRLPGLAGIIVQINHVLYGLVAMCILSHIGHGHFCHFVNRTAIGTYFKSVGHTEHAVELRYKFFVTAGQFDQSLHIMKHAPQPMPGSAFRKRTAPFGSIEVGLPFAFGVSAAHMPGGAVVYVAVIVHLAAEN